MVAFSQQIALETSRGLLNGLRDSGVRLRLKMRRGLNVVPMPMPRSKPPGQCAKFSACHLGPIQILGALLIPRQSCRGSTPIKHRNHPHLRRVRFLPKSTEVADSIAHRLGPCRSTRLERAYATTKTRQRNSIQCGHRIHLFLYPESHEFDPD
jgi:hypothetical protein